MSAAEQGQSRYIRIADRAGAPLFARGPSRWPPSTLTGWMLPATAGTTALMTAVAVLIITCPCALGLAVPAVQVVASGRLFRSGVHDQGRRGAGEACAQSTRSSSTRPAR